MIPVVEEPFTLDLEWVDGIELHNLNAPVSQAAEKICRGLHRSDAVIDQADLNALSLFFQQKIGKFFSDFVAFKNIEFPWTRTRFSSGPK